MCFSRNESFNRMHLPIDDNVSFIMQNCYIQASNRAKTEDATVKISKKIFSFQKLILNLARIHALRARACVITNFNYLNECKINHLIPLPDNYRYQDSNTLKSDALRVQHTAA